MDETLERERAIHDRLAAELDPAELPPRPPSELEDALLARLGDVAGKEILDLGCGQGDLALILAQRSARVTALDLSPGMVGVVRSRAARFLPDRTLDYIAGQAEAIDRPDESFDLVVGHWILHHTDLAKLAPELKRLLRPAGRAVFVENSGLNPILTFARNHIAGRFGVRRMGTPDEHPLTEADYAVFEAHFGRVERLYPCMEMFTLLDRQVFSYRRPRVSLVCNGLDRTIERHLPALKRYSFRVIVELER